jgi:hypothetical protein
LHSVWDGAFIHFWSEGPRVAHRGGASFPPQHPFAQPPIAASAAFRAALRGRAYERRYVDLSLPSDERGPVPSTEPLTGARMRTWRIPSLSLSAGDALEVLSSLPSAECAFETRVWTAASRWALSQLARGAVFPEVERNGSSWTTHWLPFLDDAGIESLTVLSQALPRPGWKSIASAEEAIVRFARAASAQLARGWLHQNRVRPGPTGHKGVDGWAQSEGKYYPVSMGWRTIQEVSELLRAWTRPLREGPPVTLSLRLNPPGEGESWSLEVLLCSGQFEMSAADAHRDGLRATPWAAHRRGLESALEGLLRTASLRLPALARALEGGVPRALALEEEEVAQFLLTDAPALAEQGIRILAPDGIRTVAPSAEIDIDYEPSAIGRDGLLAFDWRVSLGDASIDPAAFLQAVAQKRSLIKLGRRYVILDLEKARKLARAMTMPPRTVGDVLRVALDDSLDVRFDLGKVLRRQDSIAFLEAPPDLQGELRPYQARGVSWLRFLRALGLGACLADDMGLGKTVQVIALLLGDRGRDERGTVLLICPTSVVGNWQRELTRFAPSLSVYVHHGVGRRKDAVPETDVVITTYGLVARDEFLGAIQWRGVVLDEAQNVKNAETAQAKAVRRLPGGFRIALTGTPVENRLTDLWSIMDFLNPGLLGGREAFSRRYAMPIERQGDLARLERLKAGLTPLILRRVKTDPTIIADLPEKQEMKTYCPLTAEQAALYKAVVEKMLEEVPEEDAMKRRAHILTAMMKLKQVCNHPSHFLADESALSGRSGKLARLEELLDEVVQNGERALVFTQFARWGARLVSHLSERLGCEVLWLHGGTARRQRDALVERFNALTSPAVFVLSLKAGGSGLNLVGANHVFHYDRWWNPAVENQATDRAFRIGQTRNVQVHKMVSLGTLEESVDLLIERKSELAQGVLGTGEGWLTELSTDDLRRLVTLRDDLVEDEL